MRCFLLSNAKGLFVVRGVLSVVTWPELTLVCAGGQQIIYAIWIIGDPPFIACICLRDVSTFNAPHKVAQADRCFACCCSALLRKQRRAYRMEPGWLQHRLKSPALL